MHRSRRSLASALLLALVAMPGAAASEDGRRGYGPGGWWNSWDITGDLTLGGKFVTGENTDSGSFNEYSRETDGAWAEGLLRFEDKEQRHFLRSWIDFNHIEDQSWRLDGGRYNGWGLSVDAKRYAHRWSENALSAFSRGTDGDLELPQNWVRAGGPQLGANAVLLSSGARQEIDIWDVNGGGRWKLTDQVEFSADYRLLRRHGLKPSSVGQFFFGFSNYAMPVNEKTHQVTGAVKASWAGFDFTGEYRASIFDQEFDAITLDNPASSVDAFTTSARLRFAPSPDNESHSFTLSASRAFDAPFPVRFSGSMDFSRRLQDEDLLPHTINSALPNATLPTKSLNGRVNTWIANVLVTARPLKTLNLDLRYRMYYFDERTTKQTVNAGERIQDDALIDGSPHTTKVSDYRRQNADLNATWRFADGFKLKGGVGWEHWKRDDNRQVNYLNEYELRGRLDWRLSGRAWAQLGYELGYREGNRYRNSAIEFEDLRNFDLADRVRHDINFLAQFDPCDTVGMTLNAGWRDYDYNHSNYGEVRNRGLHAGVDVGWQAHERVSLSAHYTFEYERSKMQSRDRFVGTQPDTSAFDWNSRLEDRGHNAGVDMDVMVLPEKLTLKLGYLYNNGTAETSSRNFNAVDFPDVQDRRHEFRMVWNYRVHERFSTNFGYRYQKADMENFRYDPLGLYFGGNELFMNQAMDDYKAHVLEWGITFHFGDGPRNTRFSRRFGFGSGPKRTRFAR